MQGLGGGCCLSAGLGVPGPAPHLPASPQLDWRQVLVLGLDGAGKSSILHYICSQTARDRIAPTHGFNSAQLFVGGLEMDLLEGKAGLAQMCPPGLSLQSPEGHPPTCQRWAGDTEHPR